MTEQVLEVTVTKGELDRPDPPKSTVAVAGPAAGTKTLTATSGGLTSEAFEDALDKVSRPVKGKYADVPYSSEDLIRDKKTEVELEDR